MANQIFHFSNSGISSGQRFYLKDDVSGIFLNKLNVTSDSRIEAGNGIFNSLDLNNIDNLSLSGVDVTITSGNVVSTNPLSAPNLVYNTSNQTISGVKTFATGVNISGRVGIGINNNDKFRLYVRKSPAGVSVNPDDGSVAVFEGSGNSHITVLASDAQSAGVVLGSPTDPFGSYLSWNHDNSELKLATDKAGGFISLLTDDELLAVRITSGGNVGIGKGSPSEKLEVAGNVTVSGNIIVSGNNILIAPANYIYITGNQTSIVNGTKYLAVTTGRSFGFNLPASPSTGNYLEFADPFYTWSGNNFILSGNGNNIEGENSPFTGDVAGLSMKSVFVGGIYGWRIV